MYSNLTIHIQSILIMLRIRKLEVKKGLSARPVVARLKNPIILSLGYMIKKKRKNTENPSKRLVVAQSHAHDAATRF